MIGYLFTDIDGSVARWEKSPQGMRRALRRHDQLVDSFVVAHGGNVQDRAGDGVFAVFINGNPLACAIAIQQAFARENWSDVGGLAVRIGVHAAAPAMDGELDRVAINRAARFASSAWGGQVVASALAVATFGLPEAASLVDLGNTYFRGIDQPQRVFSLKADQGDGDFPPLRNVTRQTPRLPSKTSPIFGRDREIGDLTRMLNDGVRLVTILGMGGLGKTRLALEVASAISALREVQIVTLNRDPRFSAELAATIVDGLRLPRRFDRSDLAILIEYFAAREALLVIDNADAVKDEAGVLTSLLAAAPGLSILVTSREVFGWVGESVFKLGGLDFVDGGEFSRSGAAMLFAQSARTIDPHFALAPADEAAFKSIYAAVGGAPLGLHLTAQWVSVLSLGDIAARLKGDLGILSDAGASGLRDAFEGSWRLLDPVLQASLARLAVFPASFDEAAAFAVADVDISALRCLERKSLLERGVASRFALHPLVRDFALEKMAAIEAAGRDDLYRLHARHYLTRAEDYFRAALGPDQPRIAERLRLEHLNIVAAWRTAANASLDVGAAERTFYLYAFAGMFSEADAVFSIAPTTAPLRGAFDALRANCLVHLARFAEVARLAEGVLAQSNVAPGVRAHAEHALGNIAHARGALEDAARFYARAAALRRRDELGLFYTHLSMAWLELHRKHYAAARRHLAMGEAHCQRLGFTGGLMWTRVCTGELAEREDNSAEAFAAYRSALELEALVDNNQHRAMLHWKLGALHLKVGDAHQAQSTLTVALEAAGADERYAVRALTGLARVPGAEREKARAYSMDALHRAVERVKGGPELALALIALAILEAGEARLGVAGELVAIAKALEAPLSDDDVKDLGALGIDLTLELPALDAEVALTKLLKQGVLH